MASYFPITFAYLPKKILSAIFAPSSLLANETTSVFLLCVCVGKINHAFMGWIHSGKLEIKDISLLFFFFFFSSLKLEVACYYFLPKFIA